MCRVRLNNPLFRQATRILKPVIPRWLISGMILETNIRINLCSSVLPQPHQIRQIAPKCRFWGGWKYITGTISIILAITRWILSLSMQIHELDAPEQWASMFTQSTTSLGNQSWERGRPEFLTIFFPKMRMTVPVFFQKSQLNFSLSSLPHLLLWRRPIAFFLRHCSISAAASSQSLSNWKGRKRQVLLFYRSWFKRKVRMNVSKKTPKFQWDIVLNNFYRFRLFEGIYRACQVFPDDLDVWVDNCQKRKELIKIVAEHSEATPLGLPSSVWTLSAVMRQPAIGKVSKSRL